MKAIPLIVPVTLLLLAQPNWADNSGTDPMQAEAAALAAEFVGRLKPQLKQALQSGGPAHAIEVCSHQAPRIADALSAESGWSVKRVSLKARNASRAQPDAWEKSVLERFDQRQAAGEDAMNINYSEVSGTRYRYMQAQGVQGVCLVCHGENPAREVTQALSEYYPDDMATGYTAGQVRGAISLSKTP